MRALLAFTVCVALASAAAAQADPSSAATPTQPPAPTYSEDAATASASESMPAEEPLFPRLGLSLALEGARTFGSYVGAGRLGFSAAVFFAFKEPLGFAQLGVMTWPDGLRANSSGSESHPPRSWEYFVSAFVYPFEFAPVHIGFYLLLTVASFAAVQAERAALGPAVLWSISECCGLRYQLGFSTQTNLFNAALVSSLGVDVVLF
jgi:hypothetical protein